VCGKLYQFLIIQGGFFVTGRVHGSALHGDRCAACSGVLTNFADESACLTGDNIWNEVVTFHRSQGVFKMLSFLHVYMSRNKLFRKRTQVQQSFLHLQHTRHQLSLEGFSNCVAVLAPDFDTPVSSARHFSDFLGVCSSLAPMSSNFSSVSTWSLCFCFLSVKSPVVLSLFTKL
jgi:hypothetical protein